MTSNLIYQFQQKAGCIHTQYRANHIWDILEPLLEDSELIELQIAWEHSTLGEGRAELDEICNKLRKKYNDNCLTGNYEVENE